MKQHSQTEENSYTGAQRKERTRKKCGHFAKESFREGKIKILNEFKLELDS